MYIRPGENREWRNEKRLNFWQRAFRHVRFAKLFMFTEIKDDFLLLLFTKKGRNNYSGDILLDFLMLVQLWPSLFMLTD